MGYDPFSPIAPALINVLCVPAGRISGTDFTRYLEWLRVNASGSSTSYANDEDEADNGQTSNGSESNANSTLLFHFSQHGNGDILQGDSFFEPNRRPQLVLGLIDGPTLSPDDLDVALAVLQDANSKLGKFASQFATSQPSTKLIVFDPPSSLPHDSVMVVRLSEDDLGSKAVNGWLSSAATSAVSSFLHRLKSDDVVLPTLAARFERINGVEKGEDAKRQSVASTSSRGTIGTQMPNSISEDGTTPTNSGMLVSSAILFLQQGAWPQALYRFVEGARAARDANQYAWHAKALEGILICMLLLAWTGGSFQIPQDCYPVGRGFSSSSAVHSLAEANRSVSEKFAGSTANRLQALTAMLPGLLATVMNLYDKAATGIGDNFPRLLACEARVRLAAMLVIVKKHGGNLNTQTLAELTGFRRGPNSVQQLEPPSVSLTLRSASLSHLLVESVTEAQVHLPVQSAAVVYLAVCKCFSQLKLDRKQGFYLKDVLQRLPPVFVEARRAGSAGVIVPNAVSDRQQEKISHSIRALLYLAARAYDLPIDSVVDLGVTLEDIEKHAKQRLSSWYSVFTSGDIATKLEMLRLCIRVTDSLPDSVGSIQFISLLLHIARQSVTVIPGPSNPVPLISSDEQKRLVAGIQNAISSVHRITATKISADYWDDFLVREITLFEHPSAGKLMPHSPRDLSLTSSTGTNKKDPFIYNPFSASGSSTGPEVLVKDELASFEVVLQNPLEVELEVESISLITDGCKFDPKSHSVVLGPLCVQVFTLKGTPRETGTLKITGCKAQVKNCREQNFAIFVENWKPPHFAKRKNAISVDSIQIPASKKLELTIVDPLPSLSIDEMSLMERSVMLLDGERYDFSFELENTGDLEADLVLFSYEDSASRQLQDALATKDLQPADMYELQHQLTTRPAIKRVQNQEGSRFGRSSSNVGAKSKKNFEFSILGKPGLTEATVLIDYAYIGKPRNEIEGTFYTRQLRFTVNITVNGSVDIPRCSILSVPPTARLPISQGTDQLATVGQTDQKHSQPPSESCLLQLDIRSIWQTPLRATVETKYPLLANIITEDTDSKNPSWIPASVLTLLPTQIIRILLPIPKVYIQKPFNSIPSLSPSNRQFVVSASKLSLEADLAARESFWYREALVGMLRIKWDEEYGKRSGEIDVRRGIRLSSRMIDALRIEHVQITFSLKAVHAADADAVRSVDHDSGGGGNADFELKRNVFANLVVKVSNYTSEPLKLLLRLQPNLHNQPHNLAMDLGKKFVWSGVLQRVFRTAVKTGESVEAELGIVGLVNGEYEVNGTVEDIRAGVGRKMVGNGGGSGGGGGGGEGGGTDLVAEIGEKTERRIWHARRPCLIRVIDGDEQ